MTLDGARMLFLISYECIAAYQILRGSEQKMGASNPKRSKRRTRLVLGMTTMSELKTELCWRIRLGNANQA